MKKFYKEIFYGIIILFIVNLVISFVLINPIVYEPYESIMNDIDTTNSIIFSDSHGWALTKDSPDAVQQLKENGITNLSYGSDSYYDMFFKLNYLVKNGYDIDRIYLSLDTHLQGKLRDSNNNRNLSIIYTNYDVYTKFFKMSYPEYIIRKHLRKYLSLFDVNNAKLIRKYLEAKLFNKSKSENVWADLKNEKKFEESKRRHNSMYGSGLSKKQHKVLEEIITLCKENQISISFVQYPVSPTMAAIEIADSFLKRTEYFRSMPFDLITIDSLGTKYFRDQDHVNSIGANYIIDVLLQKHNDR